MRPLPWLPLRSLLRSLRVRLLVVSILAVVVMLASLLALERVARDLRERLMERAQEELLLKVERLARAPEAQAHQPIQLPEAPNCRSGHLTGGLLASAEAPVGLPEPFGAEVARTAGLASGPEVLVRQTRLRGNTVLVAAWPLGDGRVAWGILEIVDPPGLRVWRRVGMALAASLALLVLLTVMTFLSIRHDVAGLQRSLARLTDSLEAPLETMALHEFGEVRQGIATLASHLAEAKARHARMERAVQQQARLAALGRVAVGMAHEIRNPLTAIKLRADLLRQTPVPGPVLEQDLSVITSEVERLDRLLRDLLVLGGRTGGLRVEEDLGELVRTRACLLEPWARQYGVSLHVSGSVRAPVDPDGLGRVVDNLLRNAIEASPAGGLVSVDVAQGPDGAALTVVDEGPGVPEELVSCLFEPFHTTKPTGTGLGLSLSRAVATAHGGTLTYERREGRSLFHLFLPFEGAKEA